MKKELLLGLCLFSLISVNSQVDELSKSHKLKRGAYIDFNEFISNNPSIIDSFYIDSSLRKTDAWFGTYNLTPRYSETNKKVRKIWGYCDGNRAYIKHLTGFFPINIDENQYTFIGFAWPEEQVTTTVPTPGGGVVMWNNGQQIDPKNEKVKYIYDISTGADLSERFAMANNWSTDMGRLVFYRTSKKEVNVPVEIQVSDHLKYSFIPNSYTSIKINTSNSPVRIYFGKNRNEFIEVELDSDEVKFVQCKFHDKDDKPKVFEVSSADGKFYSTKPKNEQLKRDADNN